MCIKALARTKVKGKNRAVAPIVKSGSAQGSAGPWEFRKRVSYLSADDINAAELGANE